MIVGAVMTTNKKENEMQWKTVEHDDGGAAHIAISGDRQYVVEDGELLTIDVRIGDIPVDGQPFRGDVRKFFSQFNNPPLAEAMDACERLLEPMVAFINLKGTYSLTTQETVDEWAEDDEDES
jgi:hypothetical protein